MDEQIYNIRYVKLHFYVEFPEGAHLSSNKTSAIRGGIGEMMLRANCIRNRDCENCDFEEECIVQRTMYSKFRQKPDFIDQGESVGYVLECENYENNFNAGDVLQFNLILFGKTIVYFNQYLQAVYALGNQGLGKNPARFVIRQVTNTVGQPIIDGNNVYMKYYEIHRLNDYISFRRKELAQNGLQNKIVFQTPLAQKFHGEFLNEFNMEAIVKSLQRRVYILSYFEDHVTETLEDFYRRDFALPDVLSQMARPIYTERYSSRRGSRMPLRGIKGNVQLSEISDELEDLLLAGEILHIGKNTSFGFGRLKLF